jgi:hypothetical protein
MAYGHLVYIIGCVLSPLYNLQPTLGGIMPQYLHLNSQAKLSISRSKSSEFIPAAGAMVIKGKFFDLVNWGLTAGAPSLPKPLKWSFRIIGWVPKVNIK